jgi:hypothetical protein
MSAILSFDICEKSNCSSLVFSDTTGQYDVKYNLYGYGTPNEDITGATALVNITLISGSIITINLIDFPTTDKTKEFYINGTDLGFTDGIIPDGIYKFEYIVTTSLGEVLTQNKSIALYCNSECCVKSMLLDLDTECQDCFAKSSARYIQAFIMLQGLKYTSNKGDITTFNKTLTQLNKLCSGTNCQNCK